MVGIFAGRGDVIIAMALAGLIGIWIGWQSKKIVNWIQTKRGMNK
jgi:xanthosine utilization system XapX-like protein